MKKLSLIALMVLFVSALSVSAWPWSKCDGSGSEKACCETKVDCTAEQKAKCATMTDAQKAECKAKMEARKAECKAKKAEKKSTCGKKKFKCGGKSDAEAIDEAVSETAAE